MGDRSMKLITTKEVHKIMNTKGVLWHEGVDSVSKDARTCFKLGRVRYWKEGKSYVIKDKFFPFLWVYWCITKDYYHSSL